MATALSTGSCLLVCDGSLKDRVGTSAFVLCDAATQSRIIGVNIVPGPLQDGDSYRCELAGLYGSVLLVNLLCQHFAIPTGSIDI